MRFVLAAVLAVFLHGCATNVSPQGQARLALIDACDTWNLTLSNLARLRFADAMSDAQAAVVDEWSPVLNGICSGPPNPSADIIDLLNDALWRMQRLETQLMEDANV